MTGHLIFRPPHPACCSRCAAVVLVAISYGVTVTAGTTPLDVRAEITALLAGRITYDLRRQPGCKPEIVTRDIYSMRRPREYPVLADHECPDGYRPRLTYAPIPKSELPARPKTARAYSPLDKAPF